MSNYGNTLIMSPVGEIDHDRKVHDTWQGDEDYHAEQAAIAVLYAGTRLWPWSWVEPQCDEPMCIQAEHLEVHNPSRLDYPVGVCVYCGEYADTEDHLVPVTVSGAGQRRTVLTVPACRECNSTINDKAVFSINGRRDIAQEGIRRRNRSVLRYQKLTPEELSEYGPGLRPVMEAASHERETVERRLNWPDDPNFDIRHLEMSGIPDPASMGLL